MLDKLLKAVAPVAGIAMASALSGCNSKMDINLGDADGVPLAELDMSGDPPTSLVLAAPVQVVIKNGKSLKIIPEGDGDVIDRLRFSNSEGQLGIGMESGNWTSNQRTIINVTMPAPQSLTVAGSGSIDAAAMKGDADINLLGSGSLAVKTIKADTLNITIAASGSVTGAGTAEKLDLDILGSGGAQMADLSVETADVDVMGSGSAAFASDGTVKAKIMGSGSVRVIGRADCEVQSMGSGSLKCEAPAATAAKKATKTKTAAKTKKATKKAAPKKRKG